MIKRGSLVEIEEISYSDNYPNIKVYIRGSCLSNCNIGEFVNIKTITGHIMSGIVSTHKFLYYNNKKIKKNFKEILLINLKK
ncbi:hypothetical protein HBE96_23575 [Clostridium sp. P21]|uniref:Uncharacterized protein n=1 Tax=Clostridium muellerianum TaxID=2716538 RepID=A0A7Y0ELB8_9CLOT|nr:hypothetical protein [Clostridium muellerianum]NMM65561.1 hypothetical protein [Clostridium muellerianum]